jgi:hypothetical protein
LFNGMDVIGHGHACEMVRSSTHPE